MSQNSRLEAQNPNTTLEVVERYLNVPIVEIKYPHPTLLTREVHEAEVRTLVDLPFDHFAAIICFKNLSSAVDYGSEEMAEVFQTRLFADFQRRSIVCVRYGTGSLTSMVQLMAASALLSGHSSGFAPDRRAAMYRARRAIEQFVQTPVFG